MPNLLLLLVGIALMLAAALAMPVSAAPTSIQTAIGSTTAVEQAAAACTHRRVCRPGAGCAWRKVCKRW
jgi:hypothetical protein